MTSAKPLTPDSPVSALPGFGPKRAKAAEKLGLFRLSDFLTLYPRDYEDRTHIYRLAQAPEGVKACFRLTASTDAVLSRVKGGMQLVKLRAFDETGSVDITFFNRPYIRSQLRRGQEYIFYGRAEWFGTRLTMVNPLFEAVGKEGSATGRILPVYPLTAGLTNGLIESGVRRALEICPPPESPIPAGVEQRYKLPDAGEALRQIHFPDSAEQAFQASRRFAFEELFVYSCASKSLKQQAKTRIERRLRSVDPNEFFAALPFAPTNAQRRAVAESFFDMTGDTRMNRLVQGDVGSGKTLVAAACAWLCWRNGRQAVLMAPTELLARQHQKTLTKLLEPFGMTVGLIVSAMSPPHKRQALQNAADGTFDVICGTHALIQGNVAFRDAALFVIDEQHRFGVAQRTELAKKQPDGHMLVMSATPIPRTLSLIIFGDLDLSVIDEMPAGRKPIETYCVGEDKRRRVQSFLLKQVADGGQAYVVCPLIEEGEDPSRPSAVQYAEDLSRALPQLRVGVLHGRMAGAEKDEVMARFAAGELDVLVATSVIEVGIDVPNANLMIIENAESFGLSQLHQFRGRVGRGQRQSYCILIRRGPKVPRLEVIANTSDGFKVAEEDLRLRGPGDFFGRRQHGLPAFRFADRAADLNLFRAAAAAAEDVFRRDPALESHPVLKARVEAMLSDDGVKLN